MSRSPERHDGGRPLAGRTLVMSGGSRGIGLAIAVRAARDGANVALLAKTDQPDPRLPGTIHTAAAEIEAAGGRALPVVGDVRSDDDVQRLVDSAVEAFGGIDLVVNNASAIDLRPGGELPLKRFDLMMQVNVRGTLALTSAAYPWLERSDHAHVLTLSPPINPDPIWLDHAPYTVSKYAMTMLTLGFARRTAETGVAANCLWPATTVATAAVQNLLGGDALVRISRTPEVMGDAAYHVLASDPTANTGGTLIDADVLAAAGVTDLETYRADPTSTDPLVADLFL